MKVFLGEKVRAGKNVDVYKGEYSYVELDEFGPINMKGVAYFLVLNKRLVGYVEKEDYEKKNLTGESVVRARIFTDKIEKECMTSAKYGMLFFGNDTLIPVRDLKEILEYKNSSLKEVEETNYKIDRAEISNAFICGVRIELDEENNPQDCTF